MPPAEARDRVGTFLGEVGAAGTFSAARTMPADELVIEVRDVGRLQLPLTQGQAKDLCRVARPARYGQGELTILDRRVRDTWEIPKSRVKIDQRRWIRALGPVVERLGAELGVGPGQRIRPVSHSLLVYGPGQFFVPHQDSEKSDDMFGSLVVTLPSTFKGGALVVTHGDKRSVFRGSAKAVSCVAFYADCRHEIQRVTSGYRVCLTYDLMLEAAPRVFGGGDVSPERVERASALLDEHFSTPQRMRYRHNHREGGEVKRLVYLLDHEYTTRSLGWSSLKGADVARVALLRAAAEHADCEVVLAFAVRAEASPTWALDQLARTVSAGRGDEARAMAASVASFWVRVAPPENWKQFVPKAFRASDALDDPRLASMLLAPISVEMIGRTHAGSLGALTARYGDDWVCDLVPAWFSHPAPWRRSGANEPPDRRSWVTDLPKLCSALDASNASATQPAQALVAESWSWLRESIIRARAAERPSERARALEELIGPILGVLRSVTMGWAAAPAQDVVAFLCADDNEAIVPSLIAVLRRTRSDPAAANPPAAIERRCIQVLEALLARPTRDAADWSLELPYSCGCDLCEKLRTFLASAGQQTLDWPLAEAGRRHVEDRLRVAELPVKHTTRRTGRPYTIALSKSSALFERDAKRRRDDEADLNWLRSQSV